MKKVKSSQAAIIVRSIVKDRLQISLLLILSEFKQIN